MAKATKEQLELVNRFAKVPLTEDNCYVHGFRLIGTKFIPDRYLKISRELLEIYQQDAKNGDTVQIADHTLGGIKGWFKTTLQFGRFFDAQLVDEGDETQLDGWMYMKAGQKTYIEPFTTDDISEQLDAGILHDNSVGIIWDRSECSICGNDIRDYENCQHWPGRTYKINGKELLCYVIAKPSPDPETRRSMMLENSLVGVGAYPDAGHLSNEGQSERPKYTKVNDTLELKLLPKEEPVFCLFSADSTEILTKGEIERDVIKLHQLYHKMQETKDLPLGWTFGTLNAKHKEVVKELLDAGHDHYLEDALDGTLPAELKNKSLRREENELDAIVTEIFKQFNIDPTQIEKVNEQGFVMKDGKQFYLSETIIETQTDTSELSEKLSQAEAKIKELEPLAEDGRTFRKEVIEAALADGVRAQGNDFPADTWRETFSTMSINAIRDIAKTFRNQAEAQIPAGRKTEPGKFNKKVVDNIPDEAFKA